MTTAARGAACALALLALLGAPLGRAQEGTAPGTGAGAGEGAGVGAGAGEGAGEGVLSILAAPGRIERGATDPSVDWVTGFEAATGCRVEARVAEGPEEMVARMAEGGVDLVVAPGEVVGRLIAEGRVQPVDPGRIPSWELIDLRLQTAPWHTVGEVPYGVPLVWGPHLLAYSTVAFPARAPGSWGVLWEEMDLPDGQSNRGRIQVQAGPMLVAEAALYLMHQRPELGIVSPYELDEAQYAAALELLRGQRALVGLYRDDPEALAEAFRAGRVAASPARAIEAGRLAAEGLPVAATIPEEGATGWAEATLLAAEAEHPACAYLWLEHQLSSPVQSDLSAWLGAVPAVPAACSDGQGRQTPESCDASGLPEFGRIRFWRTPLADCSLGEGACVPYERWAEDVRAVMEGR